MPNNKHPRTEMSTSRGKMSMPCLNAYQIRGIKKVFNISLVEQFIRLQSVRLTYDKFFGSVNGNI